MSAIAFLCTLGIAYWIYCVVTKRPARMVYCFFAIWLFFPRFIRQIPIFGPLPWIDIRVSDFLLFIGAIGLLIKCLPRPAGVGSVRPPPRSLRFIVYGLLCAVGFSFVFALVLEGKFGHPEMDRGTLLLLIRPTLDAVYGVIFFLGCSRFITNLKRVEILLLMLMGLGCELVLEVITVYYLHLAPFLTPWVINESGRFLSLPLLSFDSVGYFSIAAICCTLYFAFSRSKRWLYAVVPLMLLPIAATLAKAPLGGAIFAVIVFGALLARKNRASRFIIAGVATLLVFVQGIAVIEILPNVINGGLGGATRSDYDIDTTFTSRIGLWGRGLDIFIYTFPVGCGSGLTEPTMIETPLFMQHVLFGSLLRAYNSVAVNESHFTNPHNAFVEFVAENGLPGLLVEGFALVAIGSRLLSLGRRRPKLHPANRKFRGAEACVFAALVGLGWNSLFESGDKHLPLVLLLLYLVYMLPRFEIGEVRRKLQQGERSETTQEGEDAVVSGSSANLCAERK